MRKSTHHQTLAVLLALIASASGGCGDAETGAGGATTTASASGGMGSGGGATTGTGGAGGGGGGSGGSTGTFMGAPCAGDKCDVTLNGLDFTPDNGLMVHAGIVPQGSNKGFIWEDAATVANGTFTVQGVAVLTKGVGYFLNFYVDKNQNGACDSTPTDNVYRISISPVQGHVVADVTRDKNLSNIGCGGF
ncbi:MAG TPA: hypothetical protein VE093_12055 [Polyangiaceae bacterium]|nr:hypothetical protein [Polyangiaceae bacterium]